jgi:hypothetical protein
LESCIAFSAYSLVPVEDSAKGGNSHQQQERTHTAKHQASHGTPILVKRMHQTTQAKK